MSGYLQLYQQLGITADRQVGNEITVRCPFHEDSTASLSINVDTGLFKCFAASCNKGGNYEKFVQFLGDIAHDLTVDPKEIEEHHERLLKDETTLQWLYTERGLSHETIVKYRLGCEAGRVWIPIKQGDRYVNVRRHSTQGKVKQGKTLSYQVGSGKVRLWPEESLKAKDLWLCEGELDCLVLLQHGLNAVTTTGGAGSWKDSWTPLFAGKNLRIVYDVDQAGLDGARSIAQRLVHLTSFLKLLILPVKFPNKDVTDYFIKEGHSLEELLKLDAETEQIQAVNAAPKDTTVHKVPFHLASQQPMVGKRVSTKVVVAGKDLAPFSAPKDVRFTCRMGLRICAGCSIARNNGAMRTTLDASSPDILKLINCTEDMQKVQVRKMVGIVPSCPRFDWQVETFHNLEEIKLLPDLEYTPDTDTEYVIRQGYYVGDGLRTNQSYEAEGLVTPHPATQYVTFLFPKMAPTKSSIQAYQPTEESVERLRIFNPRSSDPKEAMERWKDIAADLTSNVTRIYQREDIIYAVDMVLHSVLAFNFQGQPVTRGWTEGLILGDTRCGKSETVKCLVQHYKMGEIVTGENVSYAGLVGGLQQSQKRWSITWGKIPLNDRRALVIDEVSGMAISDIERMSGIRSSGIAEITKIQTERTLARARLLWVSNPRAARPLNTYDSGAQVIKELIGRPEDIARFDYCLMVSSSEVPIDVINKPTHLRLPHRFNSEVCHELLLWLWSRTREQVKFTDEAVQSCLDKAATFARTYSADLPLVEPNEQRIKFARLGAAVAGRLFSTEDGQTLLVKPEHVEIAAMLLERWYNNTNFNYRFYSELKLKELDLTKEDETIVLNTILPFGIKFCQGLLGNSYIRLNDIEDLTGRERKDAKAILSVLVQCGAVKRKSAGYIKTPGFIRLLRNLKPAEMPKINMPEF